MSDHEKNKEQEENSRSEMEGQESKGCIEKYPDKKMALPSLSNTAERVCNCLTDVNTLNTHISLLKDFEQTEAWKEPTASHFKNIIACLESARDDHLTQIAAYVKDKGDHPRPGSEGEL